MSLKWNQVDYVGPFTPSESECKRDVAFNWEYMAVLAKAKAMSRWLWLFAFAWCERTISQRLELHNIHLENL